MQLAGTSAQTQTVHADAQRDRVRSAIASGVEPDDQPSAPASAPLTSDVPGHRRSWPVLTVLACIVSLQLLVTLLTIDLMAAVRSYVTGESLYSKGQKNAQFHLIDYAEHHREEAYVLFQQALSVPIGDRMAREALQQPQPDVEVARAGLLQGGTHPDDVPGAIRLFRWFHKTPLMSDAIASWTEGDRLIEQMRVLAERAHASVAANQPNAPEVLRMRESADELNKQLTDLQVRFASQLSDGARLSQRLLLALNLSLALLLGLSGLTFVRKSSRIQAATENEVRRRGESLKRLLDSAAEGLYGIDTIGRCTFINRAALRMLGYDTEAELLGRDMHALVQRSHHDDSPGSGQSRMPLTYREAVDLHVTDERFWRRDGTCFPVEYWSHPMMKDGQVEGAVATFFDISERIKMQEALRQGEVRIAGLVDAVNDGVVTIDRNERVVLFNRAAERLFGVPAAQAIGSPLERFIDTDSRLRSGPARRSTRFAQIDAGRPDAVTELTGRRSDGHRFPIEASLSRVEAEGGALVTAVLRDVTELQLARAERQAREALEAASRAKTDFLSRMSHELRTPLNAVLGFARLLHLDNAEPLSTRQIERVQRIETAGGHLLALVNDVLDLSRVESGQMTMTLKPIAVQAAFEDALTMLMPLVEATGIDVRIVGLLREPASAQVPDESDIAVLADRVRLRQILVNLLSNAIKYNRPGGRVRITWTVSDAQCRLCVSDTGLGITPEKLKRLFEPFNRLGFEDSKIEGTGIGLVLSRRLSELMRGGLEIESGPEGTMAWLTLGCTYDSPTRQTEPSRPSQHGSLGVNVQVLYAEDNEVNAELVRQIVTLRPSIVLSVAENGKRALEMAKRAPVDLMLVDMNLGDMTGLELAQALRADVATAGIRLVALSADALPEQINAAIAAGFESYLTKPIDFRELLNVLDSPTH